MTKYMMSNNKPVQNQIINKLEIETEDANQKVLSQINSENANMQLDGVNIFILFYLIVKLVWICAF